MVGEVLERLLSGGDLDAETMEACFGALMGGEWSEAQQAAFLIALRAKGESADADRSGGAGVAPFALPVATAARRWSTPAEPAATVPTR
jgi:anthranilate phosphoribosyltransferase